MIFLLYYLIQDKRLRQMQHRTQKLRQPLRRLDFIKMLLNAQ